MVNVPDAILVLFPSSVPAIDWVVVNGEITYWDPALGQPPTAKQLAAVTDAQVTAYRQQQARAAAQAILNDPGPLGTALRAVYLAAGLTAAQVSAQLPAASQGG
jgi:hypothetical protein